MKRWSAAAHGCEAGTHQEALDRVYVRRILRGADLFSARKLGAFGANLAALASFFDAPPWQVAQGDAQSGREHWESAKAG